MRKVLIVDDESLVRIGLKSMMDWSRYGLKIADEAADGESAFKLYQELQPDLVITDIKMPRKDGLWLIKMIRQLDKNIPIIVLTCHDEFQFVREALRLGANEYLIKAEIDNHSLEMILAQFMQNFSPLKPDRNQASLDAVSLEDDDQRLIDLLTNPESDAERIDEAWHKRFRNQPSPVNCVFTLLVQDDPSLFKNRHEKDVAKKSQVVIEIVTQILQQQKLEFLINGGVQEVAMIIKLGERPLKDLRNILEIVQMSILRYCNFSMSGIYSNTLDKPSQLPGIAGTLKGSIDRLFYMPANALIPYGESDTSKFQSMPGSWQIKTNSDIQRCISTENKADWNSLLIHLKKEIQTQAITPSQVKLLFNQSVNRVIENYHSSLSNDFIQNFSAIAQVIPNHRHFDLLVATVGELGELIIDQVKLHRVSHSQDYVQLISQYIEQNFQSKITLNDIANHVMLSKNYVSSLFKKDTGTSLNYLLNQVRIRAAMTILQTENVTAKDLFSRVGYSDEQYFCKIFRKITGQTVSQYKESLKS